MRSTTPAPSRAPAKSAAPALSSTTLSSTTRSAASSTPISTDSTLTIHTGNTVTNAGTLEATNGGTLQVDDAVTNSNVIAAHNSGSAIILAAGGSNSGTITATGGGAVTIDNANNSSVFNSNLIQAGAGGTITIDNTSNSGIWNSGTLEALTGGTVNIYDLDDNIKNAGTIEADGGTINITHDHSSITNLNLVEAIDGGTINITNINDISGGGNAGTEKADGGTFNVHGGAGNSSGGTIEAIHCGIFDIFDGGLNNASGGTVKAASGGVVDINGALNNASGAVVEALSCGTLNINSGVGNSGTITADDGRVAITTSLTNSNGGTVEAQDQGTITISCAQVSNETGSLILASGAGSTVTIDHSHIENAGGIGAENGGAITIKNSTLDNSGDGDANGIGTESGGAITIDCSHVVNCGDIGSSDNGAITIAYSNVCNNGEIGADTGGTITFEHSHIVNNNHIGTGDNLGPSVGPIGTIIFDHSCVVNNGSFDSGHNGEIDIDCSTIDNTNGTIQSGGPDGGNSSVQLSNATITGGTLATLTGGVIETVADSTLDGLTIVSGSTIQVDSGATLTLDNDTATGTTFHDASNAVLAVGGGTTLTLSGVTVHGGVIDDYSTNTSGAIVAGNIDITGDSTFCDVDIRHGNLTVEGNVTLTLSGVTVDGTTIDDYTNSGSFVIPGTIHVTGDSAINNSTAEGEGGPADGGTAGAIAVDCNVTLTLDDTTLEDLNVTNNGTLQVGGTHTLTLDNVRVTDNGTIDVGDAASGAILSLDDGTTIAGNGTGTLTINANSTLDVEHGSGSGPNHGATLDGVHVTDNGALDVGDMASGAILTLDDGSTIGGCGTMTINANSTLDVNGGTTTIDLVGTITNDGTIEASCGGTLDIVSHVDNSSGALEATSGGKLDIESAICGGTATIHGATLEFDASSNVHVTFDNGSVDSPTYGMLVLGDPEDFHGIISDFTGTCADSAHSDVIDLQGIDYTSETFHECYDAATGVLTVTDGTNTAYLNFDDFTGTFKFASDGDHGTYVYDPPVGGSKDAPATATTAPVNDHVAASPSQNGTDHAASPANEAGFGGDQDSAAAVTAQDGAAAQPANQLAFGGDTITAPPSATSALDSSDLAAFDNDHVAVPTAGPVSGSVHNGAVTISIAASPIAVVAAGTPVLESEHLTNSTIVDGSGAAHDEVAPPTAPAAPGNEHTAAPATVTAPPPAASPTLGSASLGGSGNDSFAFHPESRHRYGAEHGCPYERARPQQRSNRRPRARSDCPRVSPRIRLRRHPSGHRHP